MLYGLLGTNFSIVTHSRLSLPCVNAPSATTTFLRAIIFRPEFDCLALQYFDSRTLAYQLDIQMHQSAPKIPYADSTLTARNASRTLKMSKAVSTVSAFLMPAANFCWKNASKASYAAE